jgi:hypothetical protein
MTLPNINLKQTKHMAKTKIDPKLKSSSESQIAGMIAKIFGVMPLPQMDLVFDQIIATHGQDLPALRHDFHLYPWECPLPSYVMSDKINTLVEDLTGSDGTPYIVKDSGGIGRSSLWVVRASFDESLDSLHTNLPVRSLMNHFLVGDEWLRVIAYQLETCLRKIKNTPNL